MKYSDPAGWVKAVRAMGYSAAYCPVKPGASGDEIRAYEAAAKKEDIIIAEVGAWSNPISPDEKIRAAAFEKCVRSLELADAIGARCCVNITGSRNDGKGPNEKNLSIETFDMIVEVVRKIIDAVKPIRSYYCLETMPWSLPDSVSAYEQLMKAVDRDRCGAHMDPVNLLNSPRRCYNNKRVISEFFEKLGPYIRSCHAKDTLLQNALTVDIDEVRPGLGILDYKVYLRELSKLGDVPLLIEHLQGEDEYRKAAEYIRSVGEGEGIEFA
jgi:sugar phosphate isomerase/epimerase